MDLKELYDARAKAVHDAREILDRAEREKRDLSSEETGRYERIDQEVDALNSKIAAAEQKAAAGRRPVPPTVPGAVKGGDGAALTIEYPAGLNIPQRLRGRRARTNVLRPGTDVHLRAQDRYQQQFLKYLKTGREQLGLQVSKDTKGGFLAPTTWVSELIKTVDDMVWMRQLCRVLPPLGDSVSLGVPTRDSRLTSAEWTAEIPASDIAEDDSLTFGKRELMPHLLMKMVKAGNKLLRSSSISADSFIRDELSYCYSTTLENVYCTGTGQQQPLGIFVASDDGVPTSRDVLAATTTNFTADNIIDLLYNLKPQYQQNATGLFHRDTVKRIRKLKSGDGDYLWQPGLDGTPSTIMGRPYVQSEFAPGEDDDYTAGQYIGMFADFYAGYWIVDSLQLEVQVLAELFSLRNQTGYVGRLETDGAPVLPEAFSRLKLKAS